jgi:putative ABC transport system permease protein
MRDWQAYVRGHLALKDLTPAREARIVRELAAQFEDFYREALARGLGEADADAHARSQITDWARLARDVRDADRPHRQPPAERIAIALEARQGLFQGVSRMFATLTRDVRYGVRQLVRTPGFSIIAVLTLALGTGASSAIFSVVNGVLLKPLPYAESDALVRVNELVPQYGRFSVAPATFLDWRSQNHVFERLATYGAASGTFQFEDGPERITGVTVSWDMFALLRVSPAMGTTFTAAQDAPGQNNVIILSNGLWQRRFDSNPDVIGKPITISGTPVTVAGVMPPDFYFPSRTAEFWRPIALNPADAPRGAHFLGVIGRLKPGVSQEQAGVEMKNISERLAKEYPQNSANESAEVVRLIDQVVGDVRPALLTLMVAVGVVVLIACANVANLLLVRASVRERELAIRTAMGAGRGRLIVQMLAESLVLALVGGALGLGIAYLAIPAIQSLAGNGIPRVRDIAPDIRVYLFAGGTALLTGLIFGLAPAWQASRSSRTAGALKDAARGSSRPVGRWLRSGLLVTEVALSLVLLIGASLLLRSFAQLTHVDPGFKPEGVLAFQVGLPAASYKGEPEQLAFFDRLTEQLSTAPGVKSVGLVHRVPLVGGYVLSVSLSDRPKPDPGSTPSANFRSISPGYFQTLGIPLRRGRIFTSADAANSAMVVIIDDAFARKHFPNEDPIGRQLDIGNGTKGAEIVGIVGDVSYEDLESTQAPTMYVPLPQDVFSTMWVLARTDRDPNALASAARQVVRDLDRTLPTFSMSPLTTLLSDSMAQRRFSMLLLLVFAGLALFLAVVGLYGVVSYTVAQRTREIGLRLAIGAQPGQVLRMIVGGGMKLAALGIVIGLALAAALNDLIRTMLFKVEPFDPMSYAATAALLFVVATAAAFVPARRAMRVDPVTALQQE